MFLFRHRVALEARVAHRVAARVAARAPQRRDEPVAVGHGKDHVVGRVEAPERHAAQPLRRERRELARVAWCGEPQSLQLCAEAAPASAARLARRQGGRPQGRPDPKFVPRLLHLPSRMIPWALRGTAAHPGCEAPGTASSFQPQEAGAPCLHPAGAPPRGASVCPPRAPV